MAIEAFLTRRSLLVALPVLFGSLAGVLAEESPRPRIRMAFNGNFRPFSFRESGGPFTGILVDIFDRLAQETGLRFDYDDLPWARAQQMARAGHLDGLCTISTAERRGYLEFAPTPLFEEPTVIVFRAGDPRTEIAATSETLRGLHLSEPLGSGWVGELLPDADLEWTADVENILGMIAAGRADASLLGLWSVKAQLGRLGLESKLSYQPVTLPAVNDGFRFGVRKAHPRCRDIVARVEAAIVRLKASGAIDAIIQRYIA